MRDNSRLTGTSLFAMAVVVLGLSFFFVFLTGGTRRHENFAYEAWTVGRAVELFPLWTCVAPSGGLLALAIMRSSGVMQGMAFIVFVAVVGLAVLIGIGMWQQ